MDDADRSLRWWVGGLIAMAACAIAGPFVQAHYDAQDQSKLQTRLQGQLERERVSAAAREASLDQIIESERKRRADDDQRRTAHWSAFSVNAGRVRNELEALLAASRAANDACTGRIAAVSEDVGELGELLGRGVELLEKGQIEVSRLRAENERLAGQVDFWQQRYADEHQRITITARKP